MTATPQSTEQDAAPIGAVEPRPEGTGSPGSARTSLPPRLTPGREPHPEQELFDLLLRTAPAPRDVRP